MLTEDDIIRPEYSAHPLVDGTTVEEKQEISVSGGSDAQIILSDNSGVFIPDLKTDASVELKKESNRITLDVPGLKTSGYMLSLTIEGNNSNNTLMPVITIPKSQVGSVNPATINIIRVSDEVCIDGSVIKSNPRCLPVTIDKSGNYTAVDYFLPYTASANNTTASEEGILKRICQAFIPTAYAEGNGKVKVAWVGHVQYSIMTFQDHLNWGKNPRLVQMIPDRKTDHFRHPATHPERSTRTAPVVNVIVLVHGHNENEKDGYVPSQTADFWQFDYKRDVWNYMYKHYLDISSSASIADANKKDSCTIFYEFVYPSYRPIFTPVLVNTNEVCRTLGQDFGEAVNNELLKNNPQVAEMIKNNIPFNLFIVAHSQGGLVARAGIRYFDSKVLANFRQLITWGTPHQGSPLFTLRYIAAAGFNVRVDGLIGYPYWSLPKKAMDHFAMDAPGIRDLRWTNGSNSNDEPFNFAKYFSAKSEAQDNDPDLSLESGSRFYNDNLRKFNATEQFADKYTFLTGSTSKTASVKVDKGWILPTKGVRFYYTSDIEKGSYLINLCAGSDKYKPNDGASPVWGQAGMDLSPRPETIDMGDVDHQEFYEDHADVTAETTFDIIKKSADCNCPYIDGYKNANDTITARLNWPDDKTPGKRIGGIEASLFNSQTNKLVKTSTEFSFNDPGGTFTGILPAKIKDTLQKLNLVMKIKTIDGSIVEYATNYTAATFYIGQRYGGGIIFYIDSTGQHGLIAAEKNLGSQVPWGYSDIPAVWDGNNLVSGHSQDPRNYQFKGTKMVIGSGQMNTNIILKVCDRPDIAARLCDQLVLNGYSDWFLPSCFELRKMWINRCVISGISPSFGLSKFFWSSSVYNNSGSAFSAGLYSEKFLIIPTSMYQLRQVRAIRAF